MKSSYLIGFVYVLLLFACLLESTLQQDTTEDSNVSEFCVQGCLKCNMVTGFCEICDLTKGYITTLDNKGCSKSTNSACVVFNLKGECASCKNGFFYHAVTKTCQEVSIDDKVSSCLYYDPNTRCIECIPGFYLDINSKCQIYTDGIEGCIKPKSTDLTLCEICEKSKMLTSDGKKCKDPASEIGCSSFKNAQCIECGPGYVLNVNNYMLTINKYLTSIKGANLLDQILQMNVSGSVNFLDHEVCTKPTVLNCQEYTKFDQCKICNEGYFLSVKKDCIENPEDQIQYCLEYKSKLECTLCKDHFYYFSNDPSVCLEGDKVSNCVLYAINSNSCETCDQDFYLKSNICEDRVKSKGMATCQIFDPKKDECKECKPTFAVTLDGCQPGIENCAQYEDSAVAADQLACTKCNDGFYFFGDENKCKQPSSFFEDFCEKYKFTQPVCDLCKDKYFFDTQIEKCKIHDNKDPNCSIGSRTARNSCQQCKQGYKAYTSQKICKSVASPIKNCLEYETEIKCKKCALNYYGNTCTAIAENMNCQKVFAGDISKCEICKDNYFTNATPFSNKCITATDGQFNNCEKLGLKNGDSLIECLQCVENSYPLDFNHHDYFICSAKSKYEGLLPTNCKMIKYITQSDSYLCTMCEQGYFLTNNTCLADCPSETTKKLFAFGYFNPAKDLKISDYNICHSPSSDFPNCEIIVPRVDINFQGNEFEYVCGKCKATYDRVVEYMTANGRLKTHSYSTATSTFKTGLREPVTTCEKINEISLMGTTTKKDCDIFGKFTVTSATKYGCLKCVNGKTGKVVKVASNVDYYVIEECTTNISGCLVSETNYQGITPGDFLMGNQIWNPFELYLSCVLCQGTATTIPFVSYKMSGNKMVLITYRGAGNILDGDMTVEPDPPENPDPENPIPPSLTGESVSCRDYKNPTHFNMPADTIFIFADNCALGAYNVSATTAATAVYCLSCKKGFKPVMAIGKVTVCQEIDKCIASSTFNNCSNCEVPYDESTKTCSVKDIADPNCLRSVATECKVCKPLYSLNDDKVCEKVSVYKCKAGHFELESGFATRDLEFIMTQIDRVGVGVNQIGCSQCDDKYVAIHNLKVLNVCVESEYIKLSTLPNDTAFIKNCLKYGFKVSNNSFLCKVCKSGMIPNGDLTACVMQLPGCLQTKVGNDLLCEICDLGTTKISNKCESNAIANCNNFTTNGASLFCEKCLPGYYIKGSVECLQGKVTNCNIYANDSAEKCLECNPLYVKYENIQGKTFCLNYEEFNCLEWTNASSFSCNLCATGYYPTTPEDTDPAQMCVGGNYSISNCSELDATLLCVSCISQYYLNSSRTECLERERKINNCEIYSPNTDECQKCVNVHYIHSNGQCYPYPIGVQFCNKYSTASTCIKCDANKYLANNLCHNITEFVDNCKFYLEEGKCSGCADGNFFVNDTTCQKIVATGCSGYKSATECLSCPQGFGFVTLNNVKSCSEVLIANCSSNTLDIPYKCTQCDKNFYLEVTEEESKCTQANPGIDSCNIYSDNNHCAECKEFFVLSIDRTKCMSNFVISPQIDFNCKNYHEQEFACATCGPNKYFVAPSSASSETSDTGTPNSETAARLLSYSSFNSSQRFLASVTDVKIPQYTCEKCGGVGCFLCDPYDFSLCTFCAPSFHMKKDGKCHPDTPESTGPTNPTQTEQIWYILNSLFTIAWLFLL